MQRTPPFLLAMEEAAYSSSPPCNGEGGLLLLSSSCDGGGGLLLTLNHVQENEEDDMYLIVRRREGVGGVIILSSSHPCDGVRSVLLIFTMEEAPYLQDRRQGVQCILHRKIEDEEWVTPPLLLAMEHASYSSSSSILRVGCILHHKSQGLGAGSVLHRKEETRSTPPTPYPYDGVHSLLLVLVYMMKYAALALLSPLTIGCIQPTPPIQSVSCKFGYYDVYTGPKENCILFSPISS